MTKICPQSSTSQSHGRVHLIIAKVSEQSFRRPWASESPSIRKRISAFRSTVCRCPGSVSSITNAERTVAAAVDAHTTLLSFIYSPSSSAFLHPLRLMYDFNYIRSRGATSEASQFGVATVPEYLRGYFSVDTPYPAVHTPSCQGPT